MRMKIMIWSAIVGVLIFVAMHAGPGFGKGVGQSEHCKANPDNWWCQLWDGK